MPAPVLRALPWLFLLVALFVGALAVAVTAPDNACDSIPTAFGPGVDTSQSSPGDYLWLHCEVTDRSTGDTVESTDINWYGPLGALAGCIGAWLLGASLAGTIDRRRGLIGVAVSRLVVVSAMIAFFG